MIRGNVRFHREGENFAISTNTETERDFLDGIAAGLGELRSTPADLARWLPLVVDIAAKFRGYKADVVERRVLIAGAWLPADTANIVAGAQVNSDSVVGALEEADLVKA